MSATRSGIENYKMFLTRLQELFACYRDSKSIDTLEGLVDDCILVRFLDSLNPNTREFVLARKPKRSTEAADAADLHYEIQGNFRKESRSSFVGKAANERVKPGEFSRNEPVSSSTNDSDS
jgi:hypothetical protein